MGIFFLSIAMTIGVIVAALVGVERANRDLALKEAMKERGIEYCLIELAITDNPSRRAALKSAIQELRAEAVNKS
jgi:hypothetical protein